MPNEPGSFSFGFDKWPSVLALPLKEYQREQQPFLKLWAMCDFVELTLRLAAVEQEKKGRGSAVRNP